VLDADRLEDGRTRARETTDDVALLDEHATEMLTEESGGTGD
jgi:hypothetical protein